VIDAPASAPIHIALSASPGTPLVNPAFVLPGWSPGARARDASCKVGQTTEEARDGAVVWCQMRSDSPVTLEIAPN